MPPEPSPWDRKEAGFRDRKHDRGPPDAAAGGAAAAAPAPAAPPLPRWRDPHRGPREFYSPSPRRPPSGHHRAVSAEEAPSRSEDEGFRCYSGRYGSSSGRDGRGGYLRRSPWNSLGSPRENGGSVQRSVPDPPKPSASPSSTIVSLRDHRVRAGGDAVDDGPGTGQRHERERDHSLGSISWKPLKWPRSGSFSSPKAAAPEAEEGRPEPSPASAGKDSPVPAVQAELAPAVADEGHQRKRQRLGWGQGLAKYEKEKVEGSEVNPGKAVTVPVVAPPPVEDAGGSSNIAMDCTGLDSPTSLQSGAFSSPQALEDKSHDIVEAAECKKHAAVVASDADLIADNCLVDSSIEIDDLDISALMPASFFVANLLQPEDTSTGDLYLARQADLDKLLRLKSEISKLIEKAESVIDSCEIELKNLNDDIEPVKSFQVLAPMHGLSSSVLHCTTSPLPNNNDLPVICISSDAVNQYVEHGSHDVDNAKKTNSQFDISGDACKEDSDACHAVDDVHSHTISNKLLHEEVDFCLDTKIFLSNRELARKASEAFSDCSTSPMSAVDVPKYDNNPNRGIREKLMVRKHSLRFKERLLTLKFKAFHHLWRDDLRLLDLLCVKKNASKTQRRSEVKPYMSQTEQQKPRSSTRAGLLLPGGNVSLSPTAEILNMTDKLILGSEVQMHRENLRMPAMILDERERMDSIFITSNGLVEDPFVVEKEKALINPWTEEEQKVFMEKLVMFGKDFRKIASFLDHKTTADCIEFYYKNHKLECFEGVRKILRSQKQTQSSSPNYMVALGNQWKHETSTASLDMLGAASMIVSRSNDIGGVRHRSVNRSGIGASNILKVSRGNLSKASADSLAETVAADVLAGIGSAISSEGMSSCVTSSVDPMEKVESMPVECHLPSEVSQPIFEEEGFSDEGCGEFDSIDWSDDEKSVFIEALRLYGKDFSRISVCLGTRSREQCQVFFSKARKCLCLDMVCQGPTINGDTLLSDVNGGRSDTDEACAAEIDSTVCSTPSSKVDTDWVQTKPGHEAVHTNIKLQKEVGNEETALPSFEGDGENHHSHFRETDIQFPEALQSSKLVNECLVESHPNNCSLGPHVVQQTSDEMDGRGAYVSLSQTDAVTRPIETLHLDSKDMIHKLDTDGSSVQILKPNPKPPVESFGMNTNHPRESMEAVADGLHGSAFPDSNCHQGTYGSYFLDTVFVRGQTLQQGLNMSLIPRKKSHAMPWKQKENSPATRLLQADVKTIAFKAPDHVAPLSQNFDLDGDRKYPHLVHCAPSYDANQSLTAFDQSGQTLRGYPLHLLNMKNDELGDLLPKPVSTYNSAKKNGSTVTSQLVLPDLHADNCNKVGLVDPETASYYVRNSDESTEVLLKPCFQESSIDAEKQAGRTGNVKLFGQILSHPSSLPNPNNTEVKTPSIKESRILNFRLPNGRPDGTYASIAETCSDMGLAADSQTQSYGWWDGYRIQTGFSSFANSAVCLSKSPSVVSGVSYQPKKVKPVSSRGIVPQSLFSMDGRGQIVFPELQSRSSIDGMSGLQQPPRVPTNLVGGGDALGCAVVSDSLAALRLHFAKQITSLGSSEELHRDLGKR